MSFSWKDKQPEFRIDMNMNNIENVMHKKTWGTSMWGKKREHIYIVKTFKLYFNVYQKESTNDKVQNN